MAFAWLPRLVESHLELFAEPLPVKFTGTVFFDEEVERVRLGVLDPDKAPRLHHQGLPLVRGWFRQLHAVVLVFQK